MTDIGSSGHLRQLPRCRAAERGDLPEHAGFAFLLRWREIHDAARVGRPSRVVVIDVIARDLEGIAAGEPADPDLAAAVDSGATNASSLPSGETAGISSMPTRVGDSLDARDASDTAGRDQRPAHAPSAAAAMTATAATASGRSRREGGRGTTANGVATTGCVDRIVELGRARRRCRAGAAARPSRDSAAAAC